MQVQVKTAIFPTKIIGRKKFSPMYYTVSTSLKNLKVTLYHSLVFKLDGPYTDVHLS